MWLAHCMKSINIRLITSLQINSDMEYIGLLRHIDK